MNTEITDPPLAPDMVKAVEKMAEIAAEQGLGGRREEMSPAEGRARMEAERAWWNDDLPAVAKSVDTAVDSDHVRVPVRLIYPTDAANPPVLIYLHGGGWVMGSLQTHHRAMRYLALASGAVVVAVDYALSPEARFPVALEQSLAVIDHVRNDGADWGLDPARVALGGDSAGANLAAAAALRLRDSGARDLAALLLFYGVFDCDFETASYRQFADGRYGLSREMMEIFFDHYVGPDGARDDPGVAVLANDLAGLPPTHVYAAELDVLREDSVRFESKLRAAGVPGDFKIYPGMVHAFINLTRMVDDAHDLIDRAAGQLRENFAGH